MNNEANERTPGGQPTPSETLSPATGETGIRHFLYGFAAAFGIGASRTPKLGADTTDISTRLAHKHTSLALDRTDWAAGRTLMGWIRTALSVISFGFTIGKLGHTLKDIQVTGLQGKQMVDVYSIAYLLVILEGSSYKSQGPCNICRDSSIILTREACNDLDSAIPVS